MNTLNIGSILAKIQQEVLTTTEDPQTVCSHLFKILSGDNIAHKKRIQIVAAYPTLAEIFSLANVKEQKLLDINYIQDELQACVLLWLREIASCNANKVEIAKLLGTVMHVAKEKAISLANQRLSINIFDNLKLAILRKQLTINWWCEFVNQGSYKTIKERNILLGQLQFALDNLRYALMEPEIKTIDIKKWSAKAYNLVVDLLHAVEQNFKLDSYMELITFCSMLKEELLEIKNKYKDITLYLH